MNGEVEDPFPVDDCLFEETFSNDIVYNVSGQELRIRQVFGANLGVAAPVWEAVRKEFYKLLFYNCKLYKSGLLVFTGDTLMWLFGRTVGGAEGETHH